MLESSSAYARDWSRADCTISSNAFSVVEDPVTTTVVAVFFNRSRWPMALKNTSGFESKLPSILINFMSVELQCKCGKDVIRESAGAQR